MRIIRNARWHLRSAQQAGGTLPRYVFAPYFETYNTAGDLATLSQQSAVTVLNWAKRHGIGTPSFWALQRDNGGCPGTKGAGTCSGIHQPTWYFSHTFEPFTR